MPFNNLQVHVTLWSVVIQLMKLVLHLMGAFQFWPVYACRCLCTCSIIAVFSSSGAGNVFDHTPSPTVDSDVFNLMVALRT